MNRCYRLKKDFWFLKAGLIVAENVSGDFYIPMSDDDFLDCPIRTLREFVIDGNAVRADTEHFELLKNTKKRTQNKFSRAAAATNVLLEVRCVNCRTDALVKTYNDNCPNCLEIGYLIRR